MNVFQQVGLKKSDSYFILQFSVTWSNLCIHYVNGKSERIKINQYNIKYLLQWYAKNSLDCVHYIQQMLSIHAEH